MMIFSIIIATSQKRTDWLINRSLFSVYKQIGIDKTKWSVFIVDDNENENEFSEINKRIKILRNDLQLIDTDFPTTVLKNTRTRFMSGTGAWNTGIFEAYRQYPNSFISILDDDDEYSKLLYMPETYILFRFFFKDRGYTEKWWNEFNSFSPVDFETTKLIIEKNDFSNIYDLTCSIEIKDFLHKHYLISRDDIKNPNSEIFKEKEAYDSMKRKHKDIS